LSDYNYNLYITSPNPEDIDRAVDHLKAEDLISREFFSVDSKNINPVKGESLIYLSTESAPGGYVKDWDDKDQDDILHALALELPNAIIELSGVNLDDPNDSHFKKQYHGDLFREASIEKSDVDYFLEKTPWRSFESPEYDFPEMNTDNRSVFILTCVHETEGGIETFSSVHSNFEQAEAYVEEVKKLCGFKNDPTSEYFDWDVNEQTIDISKLTPARIPEKAAGPVYADISLDIPQDYDKIQNLDVLKKLEPAAEKLMAIPWREFSSKYHEDHVTAAALISIMNLEDVIMSKGIKEWALGPAFKAPVKSIAPNIHGVDDKKVMEQTMEKLLSFAKEALSLNNGRINEEFSAAVEDFKRMSIKRGDTEETRGFVYATGAKAFEGSVLSMRGYLGVVCQAYAQFLFKKLEQAVGHDPRVSTAKPFMDALACGDVHPDHIDLYTEYWHSSNREGSLREFLGMNKEEYSAWLKGGNAVLSAMAESRGEVQSFAEPKPVLQFGNNQSEKSSYAMRNFRLSYNGPSGFDYTGFDTEKEALTWAERQERLGLIKALKLMQYDVVNDEYHVIADLSQTEIKKFSSLDEAIYSAKARAEDASMDVPILERGSNQPSI